MDTRDSKLEYKRVYIPKGNKQPTETGLSEMDYKKRKDKQN